MKTKDVTVKTILQWLICMTVTGYWSVQADYACICSRNGTVYVYPSKSTSETPIGAIKNQECKEFIAHNSDRHWYSVRYLTQIVYVESSGSVLFDMCPGSPPNITVFNVVSTTRQPSTATTSHSTSSTHNHVTTQNHVTSHHHVTTHNRMTSQHHLHIQNHITTPTVLTTSINPSDGNINDCPKYLRYVAASQGSTVGRFGRKCYTIETATKLTWQHAREACSQFRGSLVHIENAWEQHFVAGFVGRHSGGDSVWIGLNDISMEGIYQWENGGGLVYHNFMLFHRLVDNQGTKDCVVIRPDGFWVDSHCGYRDFFTQGFPDKGRVLPVMCQYVLTTSINPSDGNINECPKYLRDVTASLGSTVGRFGRKCYTIETATKLTWQHAREACSQYRGSLVHIENAWEQHFVAGFVGRHSGGDSVWIGLNDISMEGIYQWENGGGLGYHNFMLFHRLVDNQSTKDCVVIRPDGLWVDSHCGYRDFFTQGFPDKGRVLPVMCQYDVLAQIAAALIG